MLTGIRFLSYLGSAVSMLAATFIIFSALAMGVMERQRTLAMLRAIGAARAQLGRLVVTEGMLLAIVGILIGCPLGFLWIELLGWRFREMFPTGVVFDRWGVLFAASCSLLAALAASLLPAWSAMRLSPLEAMTPLANEGSKPRPPFISALCGLLCIGIDPFLLFQVPARLLHLTPALSGSLAFFGHFIAGAPGMMLGFFLLSPLFVWVIERTLGPFARAARRRQAIALAPATLRRRTVAIGRDVHVADGRTVDPRRDADAGKQRAGRLEIAR